MTGPFGRGAAAQRFARTNPAAAQERATSDLQTLREAPAQLQAIRNQHEAALTEGRNALTDAHKAIDADPGLTEVGRAKNKAALHASLQSNVAGRTQSAIDALRQKVEGAHSSLMAQADRTRPQPKPGVEGMLGRQAVWARAERLLDAGMAPHKLIAETTDPEILHALADELPTYLRATTGADQAKAQSIGLLIADRMGAIAGDPHTTAHLNAREAQVHMAGLTHELGNAGAIASGHAAGNNIGSAVAGQMARQRAARGIAEDGQAADVPAESGRQAAQYAVKPGPPAPTGDAA